MAIKTKKNSGKVSEFVNKVADKKKKNDLKKVMSLMREVTGKNPKMWGSSIIGYGAYTYINTTKVENEWPLVGVSPRVNQISIYIMPGFSKYGALMKKIGPHKIGRSCLYIKDLDEIHLPTLKSLIQKSVLDMRKKYKVK